MGVVIWWKCVIKEIHVLSGSYSSTSVIWEKNFKMQEREGITARTKFLNRQQGIELKTHEKGFTLDWNTETSSTMKEAKEIA